MKPKKRIWLALNACNFFLTQRKIVRGEYTVPGFVSSEAKDLIKRVSPTPLPKVARACILILYSFSSWILRREFPSRTWKDIPGL